MVISFFVQREIASIEINTPILILIAGFFIILNKGKVIKQDLELFTVLVVIVGIGTFSAIINEPSAYDFIRDLVYFTKPLILILLGYFAAKSINNWRVVFKLIINLGVLYATYHIFHTVIYTDFENATASSIRGMNGLSNVIEIFAIALILLGKKTPSFKVISRKRIELLFITLLLISFVLYFSRTLMVGLVFLILGVLNYLKLNKKGIKYGAIFLFLIIGLYTHLYSTEYNRTGNALESFLYKLKIAPSEIFSPRLDINNKAELWDHWRAYEAFCAFESLNKSSINYVSGKGFGSLIDLKFDAPLSSEGLVRYIPILHNGYVLVLYKTGVFGLFLYFVFLFYLYYQAYQKTENLQIKTFGNLLSATSSYLIFSSLIITGLYNTEEVTAVLLGLFLYLKSNSNLIERKKL